MKIIVLFTSFFFVVFILPARQKGELHDCFISIDGDTLTLKNNSFIAKFLWNNGNIIPFAIQENKSAKTIHWSATDPSFHLPGNLFIENTSTRIESVAPNIYHPEHLLLEIINQHQGLKARKRIRVYPGIPAFTLEYALQYDQLFVSDKLTTIRTDGTEQSIQNHENISDNTLWKMGLKMPHWKVRTISFKDVTDINDNLVFSTEVMPYSSPVNMEGNLLFAKETANKATIFILKEAPNATSQILYPGYDFEVHRDYISIPFSGFPQKNKNDQWVSGYPVTIGIAKNHQQALINLRQYLMGSINYNPEDHNMIMLNTWGDRGRDGRISEEFILAELEKAHQLGITHLQIDDGWQQGLSKNSASQEGQLWYQWTAEDWQPHKDRFPNRLERVIESAREKNIKLGLWFNPSRHNDYETWETDAQIIVDLHKQTGIQYFKIDGIEIPSKLAEENLIRFFKKVKDDTQNGVFFNLDLTAGTRGGYFSYRYTGNLFLENRYTDWGNYYPYRTLRNLWMLSWYFPPQLLQVEFLNKWRNPEKYPENDPFAPYRYNFDYVFAITMPGQPLAWFEATGLPDEAMSISSLIKNYRQLQKDLHECYIFPVGDKPDGISWTGFQFFKKENNEGYVLIFRENNPSEKQVITLPWIRKGNYRFTLLEGNGDSFTQKVDESQKVWFTIPEVNSFQLLKYEPVIMKQIRE